MVTRRSTELVEPGQRSGHGRKEYSQRNEKIKPSQMIQNFEKSCEAQASGVSDKQALQLERRDLLELSIGPGLQVLPNQEPTYLHLRPPHSVTCRACVEPQDSIHHTNARCGR